MANPNLQKLTGEAATALDFSEATITTVTKLASGAGATLAAFGTDIIGTTAQDGFISIDVDGATYKIPFWAD